MTRTHRSDPCCPVTPTRASPKPISSPTFTPSPSAPSSPSNRHSRNPSNKHWVQEQQRRLFLHHLTQWSLSHDSSPLFHGKISLIPDSQVASEIGLGKSVACILTDDTFTDARKKIVIRLFPPQDDFSDQRRIPRRHTRHDSMYSSNSELNFTEWQRGMLQDATTDTNRKSLEPLDGPVNKCYKLVVRAGAGWISAREYFSKVYFNHQAAQSRQPRASVHSLDDSLKHRSELLGPPPFKKDTVTVRPLFHPFLRLPPELQEMILSTAAGHTRSYNLCYDLHLIHQTQYKKPSPISLSTMFQISKQINQYLVPYVFHATDFHFGLTGFTNFLWQTGPVNRPEIRRLTFHFGKLALLHCIRWLAPSPVFELLEPPVVTSPRSLQYFWRCQIQELARELKLLTLTIDLKGVPNADIPMVVCILQNSFGSIDQVRFIETDKQGITRKVFLSESILKTVAQADWRDMCKGYWERHKPHQYFFKLDLMRLTRERFDELMDMDKDFFGCGNCGKCGRPVSLGTVMARMSAQMGAQL